MILGILQMLLHNLYKLMYHQSQKSNSRFIYYVIYQKNIYLLCCWSDTNHICYHASLQLNFFLVSKIGSSFSIVLYKMLCFKLEARFSSHKPLQVISSDQHHARCASNSEVPDFSWIRVLLVERT